jgi:hypothetical protein
MHSEDSPAKDSESVMLQPMLRPSQCESSVPVIPRNPFATPSYISRTESIRSEAISRMEEKRWFRSRRIKRGTAEKSWVEEKDPREKWTTIIPVLGLFLGLAIAGVLVWDGLRTVVHHEYCTVLDENWSNGFDTKVWTKEAEVGGFG